MHVIGYCLQDEFSSHSLKKKCLARHWWNTYIPNLSEALAQVNLNYQYERLIAIRNASCSSFDKYWNCWRHWCKWLLYTEMNFVWIMSIYICNIPFPIFLYYSLCKLSLFWALRGTQYLLWLFYLLLYLPKQYLTVSLLHLL